MDVTSPSAFLSYDPQGLLMPFALAIVFLACNVARGAILRMVDSGPLFFGHDPVGFGLVFHFVDMFLLLIQPIRFPLIQLTALDAFIDTLLLIRLPLVNHRCLCLGIGNPVHREHRCTHC